MKRKLTAGDVADYLIAFAHEHGSFVSNLKLQKLLYYAQGWHLALFDRPLFDDRFQAWVHGPVVPAQYRRFKEYGYRNIDAPVAAPELPEETVAFLDELIGVYLPIDAYELELMTHRETPWQNARGALPPDAPSTAALSEDDMRAYFKRLAAPAA
jgi:uncharacterized phage-associated protein